MLKKADSLSPSKWVWITFSLIVLLFFGGLFATHYDYFNEAINQHVINRLELKMSSIPKRTHIVVMGASSVRRAFSFDENFEKEFESYTGRQITFTRIVKRGQTIHSFIPFLDFLEKYPPTLLVIDKSIFLKNKIPTSLTGSMLDYYRFIFNKFFSIKSGFIHTEININTISDDKKLIVKENLYKSYQFNQNEYVIRRNHLNIIHENDRAIFDEKIIDRLNKLMQKGIMIWITQIPKHKTYNKMLEKEIDFFNRFETEFESNFAGNKWLVDDNRTIAVKDSHLVDLVHLNMIGRQYYMKIIITQLDSLLHVHHLN